jgi:hypothetical protein
MRMLLRPVAVLGNHALRPMPNSALLLAVTLEAGARRLSGGAPQPGRPPHPHVTTQLWEHGGGQRAPEQPYSLFSAKVSSDKFFVLSAQNLQSETEGGNSRRGSNRNRRRGRLHVGELRLKVIVVAERGFRLFVCRGPVGNKYYSRFEALRYPCVTTEML